MIDRRGFRRPAPLKSRERENGKVHLSRGNGCRSGGKNLMSFFIKSLESQAAPTPNSQDFKGDYPLRTPTGRCPGPALDPDVPRPSPDS